MSLSRIAAFVFVILVLAVGLAEWYFVTRELQAVAQQPRFQRLLASHAPFAAKRPDSVFGFFLPEIDPNDASSVTLALNRFRGPGPREKGSRLLAFLVGNSVVFGFAEHDSLTVTGFLNRLQDDFFFVNAGVPSWVSSQMRRRVVVELLDYEPALILFWGGHNDASIAYLTASAGHRVLPDLIERPNQEVSDFWRLANAVLPHTTTRLRSLVTAPTLRKHAVDPDIARDAAKAFVTNLEEARGAAMAVGASFLAVYQPILHHHANRPPGAVDGEQLAFFDRFHEHALDQAGLRGIPVLDFGDLFDTHFSTIPVFTAGRGPDLDEQVFVDAVHLYVPGNKLVAKALLPQLKGVVQSRTASR